MLVSIRTLPDARKFLENAKKFRATALSIAATVVMLQYAE